MSSASPASDQPSVLVRALTELPEDERAIYRARYISEEERATTCQRLGIGEATYDQRLKGALRSLRRMVGETVPATQGS